MCYVHFKYIISSDLNLQSLDTYHSQKREFLIIADTKWKGGARGKCVSDFCFMFVDHIMFWALGIINVGSNKCPKVNVKCHLVFISIELFFIFERQYLWNVSFKLAIFWIWVDSLILHVETMTKLLSFFVSFTAQVFQKCTQPDKRSMNFMFWASDSKATFIAATA